MFSQLKNQLNKDFQNPQPHELTRNQFANFIFCATLLLIIIITATVINSLPMLILAYPAAILLFITLPLILPNHFE